RLVKKQRVAPPRGRESASSRLTLAFSAVRESVTALRLHGRTWHATCISFMRRWFLKPPNKYQNDDGSSRTSSHLRLAWPSLRRFGGGSMNVDALCFLWFGITSRGFGSTGSGRSREGQHSL